MKPDNNSYNNPIKYTENPLLSGYISDKNLSELRNTSMCKIGTIGNILQLLKLPDGTVKVLVEGIKRVKILDFKDNDKFITCEYTPHNDVVNKDEDLPDSWRDYFEGIGDELNIVAKEINGPSWGPKNDKIDIDELQKKIDQEDYNSNGDVSISNNINLSSSGSNEDSIKAVSMIRSYRQRGHLIAKLDPLELLK